MDLEAVDVEGGRLPRYSWTRSGTLDKKSLVKQETGVRVIEIWSRESAMTVYD